MLRSRTGPVEPRTNNVSDYQRISELQALQRCLTAAHNARWVREVACVRLNGNQPPWQTTGISLVAGESYALFARGKIFWTDYATESRPAPPPNLYGDPSFHLWARVSPGGKIQNLHEDSGSFIADCDGELELGVYMGMWSDSYGNLHHTQNYDRLRGDIAVVISVWRDQAQTALSKVTVTDSRLPPLITAERCRLERSYRIPRGWQYLTETGDNEIFHEREVSDSSHITVDAHNAQGIIRYPVDVPLTPALTLSWQWQLLEHPSTGPEDRAHYHDYVSIGAEFDNGRDLTWIWSQFLDEDHHFHCPVKDWSTRETHYVVRTSKDSRGKWLRDSRRVFEDVKISQGDPPHRIVSIWLIAVSTFSHRRLRAAFKEITLTDGSTQRVL